MFKDLFFANLQPSVNKSSKNLTILTLLFDDVAVKTIYSPIHLQFLQASDARLAWVASKMPFRFAAVNKEISQLIKQAVPEIHEEGDEVGGASFNK